MKPGIVAAVVVVILVAVGAFAFIGSEDSADKIENNATQQPSQTSTSNDIDNENGVATNSSDDNAPEVITADIVAMHADEDDCWTIINGSVYDITEYIPRHPGGSEILRACGADASTLFNSRTTEDGETVGSGTSHSNNAANMLENYKIGELSE